MEQVNETKLDLDAKGYSYKNRELDWLRFNHRVLQEASDIRNPLYERIKFLAIFSSNLDEFFRVRISKLRQLGKVKKRIRKPLGLKPRRILKEIYNEVHLQQEIFGSIFRNEILPLLQTHKIFLDSLIDISHEQKSLLHQYFRKKLLPSIRTFTDEESDIDSFTDGQLYIAVSNRNFSKLNFIEVPTKEFGRFIQIKSAGDEYHYVFLEDILKEFSNDILSEDKVGYLANIKFSKDAELYLDDEYEGDWVEQIYESLKERQKGRPVRLLIERGVHKNFQKALRICLNLKKADIMLGGERHNFSDFFAFPDPLKKSSLHYKKMPPLLHRYIENLNGLKIFDLVSKKDILLHFPYQSFKYVEDWISEAALDKTVHSIYISLYRIADESRLTTSLLEALNHGKSVTIFVEAKARFDEENNIKWGRKFEDSGAKVYYSFRNLKVHSKVMLIKRWENGHLKRYAYIGTGNFNSKTAQIYCDHAILTSKKNITIDLEQVFGILKRELVAPKLTSLIVSPYNSRSKFEKYIQQEIENASLGLPAGISAKMNSLEDKRMIAWLYKASNAGVKIRLLVRGFCCLIPGVKGQSENIIVTSVVDRFLEHGRVFMFHANGEEKIFMGSADWMTRNLDKRVEVVVPIRDVYLHRELKEIMNIQFSDTVKARIIDFNTSNSIYSSSDSDSVRSQYEIYNYLKLKN